MEDETSKGAEFLVTAPFDTKEHLLYKTISSTR